MTIPAPKTHSAEARRRADHALAGRSSRRECAGPVSAEHARRVDRARHVCESPKLRISTCAPPTNAEELPTVPQDTQANLRNQRTILDNQRTIRRTLKMVLANQGKIRRDQATILANQGRILANIGKLVARPSS